MKSIILSVYAWLFANRLFYKFNYALYVLSLKGMGILNYENNRVSGERNFIARISRRFKQPVILDVGGNEGNYSALCKEMSSQSNVYTFEPHPKTFQRLSKRAAQLQFHVINTAVSDVYEEVTLYDYASNEGSSHASLYANALSDLRDSDVNAIKVMAIPLDDFLSKNGIDHVNLLKIDAEGHELKILTGAQQYLKNNKIDVIHFEFNEMNIMSKTFMKDFYELLSGYSFYRMLPGSLLPLDKYSVIKCEIFLYQNVVAIRKGIAL